jgi:hypothetical protein
MVVVVIFGASDHGTGSCSVWNYDGRLVVVFVVVVSGGGSNGHICVGGD